MKLTFDNRREDFEETVRTWMKLAPACRRVVWMYIGICSAAGAFLVFHSVLNTGAHLLICVSGGVIFALAMVGIFLATYRPTMRWYFRQQYWSPQRDTLAGPTEVELLDDAIVRRSSDVQTQSAYSRITNVVAGPNRVTILIGPLPYDGISIARNAVTEGDFDAFVAALTERCNS